MSGFAFFPPDFVLVNSSGRPYAGAVARFYEAGTNTPLTVYTTAALSTAHGTSVTADAAGVFPAVFIDPEAGDYKVSFFTSGGSLIRTRDNLPATMPLTSAQVGAALYPRTDDEISASVTPSDYTYPPLDVRRYGFDESDTASDQTSALQAAYNVAVAAGGGVIDLPVSNFCASITIAHPGIVFRGKGGIGSATVWRNYAAAAPVTFDNSSRGIVGSGLEGIKLANKSSTYTTTDGLVIDSEATGLNQMDYLDFRDVYVYGFRDNISITGRAIWVNWNSVRSEAALQDALHIVGSDNFSQHKFYLCRFGNSARHGIHASLTFAGLTSTSVSFDTCTIEQNEQNAVRITGAYGLSGWTFSNCYFEENAGSIAASSSSPRKAHVHVDSVYAIALRFEGCVFYGNSAPDVDIDHCIYVDTATTVNVTGSVENCRFTDSVVADVYWPKNVYLGSNDYSAVPVYTASEGSASLGDQITLGTWSPGIAFGGASTGLTYTSQVGRYTMHGRMVTATGYVKINDNGSASGAATITGLPHTAANISNLVVSAAVSADALGGSLAAPLFARVVNNTTTIALYKLVTGTLTAMDESDLANGAGISVTVTYFV